MNVNQGMGGSFKVTPGGGGGFDIADLTSKLEQVNEDEQEQINKQQEFENKRKNHYKNEFQMAKLLK